MSVTLSNPFTRFKKDGEFIACPTFIVNEDETFARSKCYNFEVRKTEREVSVYARTEIGNAAALVKCESHFGDADFVFGAMIEDMQNRDMIRVFESGFLKNSPIVQSEPIASFTYEEDQIEELLTYHAEDAEIDIDTIDFNAAYNVIGEQFKAYHIDAEDPHTEYFYGLIERYFEEHIASKTHHP